MEENRVTFGMLPKEFSDKEKAKIIIQPVPYDKTSTWVKGADKGPAALLKASHALEFYDIETDSEVVLKGIHTTEPITPKESTEENDSPEALAKQVEEKTKNLLKENKFVVTIGGEHSVSIGTIKAHHNHFKNMTVLQIDAHADLKESYENSTHNHACVGKRALDLGPLVQVGIRSMDTDEKNVNKKEHIFFAKDIESNEQKTSRDDWIHSVLAQLTENVYITFDLDALDPSIMPSTGTPEPGGLGWYQAINLLKAVAENKNIVGFDIVELCPTEHNKAPDFLAAKLLYKLLSYKFAKE